MYIYTVTWYFLPRTYYRELIKFNLQHRITDCLHTVDQLIGAHELSDNQLTNYNNPYLEKKHISSDKTFTLAFLLFLFTCHSEPHGARQTYTHLTLTFLSASQRPEEDPGQGAWMRFPCT